MNQSSNELPKTPSKLDVDSFTTLYNIFRKHDWLEKKSTETIELWNKCENNDEQKLLADLLMLFKRLTSKEIETYCENIAKVVCEEWKLKQENTYLIALCDNTRPDGSESFLQSIKSSFADYEWHESQFINNLKQVQNLPHLKLDGKDLVFFDDFIGTGKTAERKINWIKDKLNGLRCYNSIRIIALASMKEAEEKVKPLVDDYYIPLFICKGISDNYPEEEIPAKILLMKNMESKLSERYGTTPMPSLGYGSSESLISFEAGNTPNNVFPIFWWPLDNNNERRRTILKRIM